MDRATIRLEASSKGQREGWQALLTRYLFDDLSQPAALEALVELLSARKSR